MDGQDYRADIQAPEAEVLQAAGQASPSRREKLFLTAIAATAALCFGLNIARNGFTPFISVAVHSMAMSWKAFWFGALDPAASITIDKVPGFLWPQALSVRAFGFHPWAVNLPQVIEGVIGVVVMYSVVRRWAGGTAGLLAAGIFATTPVLSSLFGHAMEDAALTLCLVLASYAWQRAVSTGSARALMLAGLWTGLGFQAKMLEAWEVLPAFAIAYLIAAPVSLRRRLGQLALAALVTVSVSAIWVIAVTLTPTASRPYVDGTTDNSAVAMVVGHNGLSRFGIAVPGAISNNRDQAPPAGSSRNAPRSPVALVASEIVTQTSGRGKLFYPNMASQVGWLYPLAALSLAYGLVRRRRSPRTDPVRAGLMMWGLWLLTVALTFSFGSVPHTAYLAVLGPPLAALSAYGIVECSRAYRDGHGSWPLPAATIVTIAWATYLSWRYRSFQPWLLPAVLVAGLGGCALLAFASADRARAARPLLVKVATAAAIAAMLASPVTWSVSVLNPADDGSVIDATAGPDSGIGTALPPPARALFDRLLTSGRYPSLTALVEQPGALTRQQRQLLAYLNARRDGARYVFAASSWTTAAPYILASASVLPMGGYTGQTPFPGLPGLQRLIATRQLRYVLTAAGGVPPAPGGARAPASVAGVIRWTMIHCAPVPVTAYAGPAARATARRAAPAAGQLYDCAGASGAGRGGARP